MKLPRWFNLAFVRTYQEINASLDVLEALGEDAVRYHQPSRKDQTIDCWSHFHLAASRIPTSLEPFPPQIEKLEIVGLVRP